MKVNQLECIQCNKCTVSCPLNRVDPTYSPRGYVLQALLGEERKVLNDGNLYRCLSCFQCREVCPSDVKYGQFVRDARKKARQDGLSEECKHGVILRQLQHFQAELDTRQNRLQGLDESLYADSGDVMFFMGCLPLFEIVFPHTDSVKTARNTLKILNAAGVKPVVSNKEKCCGYDQLWTGESGDFEKLARRNIALIKELGVGKVVTACAECFIMLKHEYARLEKLDVEVQHITQFAADAIAGGRLKFNGEITETVTYHDPCRLGRLGRVFEEPRNVLAHIPGLTVKEMGRNRTQAACCGVGNFSNCDRHTKFLQNDRLQEAGETGATRLITACPKCRIHFDCYLDGKPFEDIGELAITDITDIIANSL